MNKDITLEDLGYYCDNKQYKISYTKYNTYETINIYLETKTFEKKDISNISKPITKNELQAIYNKCKELGWLDE